MRFSTLVEVALVGVFVFIAAAAVAESDQAEGNSIECKLDFILKNVGNRLVAPGSVL